jgi:hypothetical protein
MARHFPPPWTLEQIPGGYKGERLTGVAKIEPLMRRCKESLIMKTYVVAGTLIALASPSLADYYVALDLTTGSCLIMNTHPTDTKHYKSMGQYSSEAEAKEAIALGRRCHRAAKHR